MKTYVNLHTHGSYSMLDGHGKYGQYMERASELNMPALCITEHGNIHGWLDFYQAGVDAGVKPILGIEAYQARKTRFDQDEEERSGKAADEFQQRGPHHLTVLARNEAGYKNAIRLSSRAYLEGYYVKPRLDMELLHDHGDGLIILSGCLSGKIQQALARGEHGLAEAVAREYQECVGKENFFIEVMNHDIPDERRLFPDLVELAKRIDAKIIPTGDCHYVRKEHAHLHDVMLCVQTAAQVDQENRFRFYNDQFYLKSYDEMEQRFDPAWLKNTLDLSNRVDLDLKFGTLYFPEFPLPAGREVNEYLEEQVWEGIVNRYGTNREAKVDEQVRFELGVVRRMGFQHYFLVVSDLVRWAKKQGIAVGWGRGSAAGAILSYALDITNLEPLRFGLRFDRFLVEGRKSMPDIDLDFDDRYRGDVIQYGREKYGDDRLAHICTFGRVMSRAAIRDSARVLGYDYALGDRVAKLIPPPVLGVTLSLEEALVKAAPFKKAFDEEEDVRKIVTTAQEALEGRPRQTGIHAAGVVIAQAPVINFVPVMRKGVDAPIVTQWPMEQIEMCGLLKIDFLAIRNLGVMAETIKLIQQRHGIEIDLDNFDTEDEATYKMIAAGDTVGVFQLESVGMRDMCISMRPNRIEDVMAIISLYRPGPMGSGMHDLYIARKHGTQKIAYEHPILEEVLDKTYGIMLYQEDVLAVSRTLAGFSAAEADDLRKAIGKKQMDKIGLFRDKFVEGCLHTHNVEPAIANKIYSDIEYFGGYGFNLAHAASYAMLSYVTAYLKAHYPAEYMACLLSSVADKPEKAAVYLNAARKMNLTVLPPSVNYSETDFRVLEDSILLFGMRGVAGIGDAYLKAHDNRNRDIVYTSVYDFLRRCDDQLLNKLTIEHFACAGAFDELAPEQPDRVLTREERQHLLDLEREQLSLYVSDHPLIGAWNTIQDSIEYEIADLELVNPGKRVTVGGIIIDATHKVTKNNQLMARFTLEDMSGDLEVVIFPKDYKNIDPSIIQAGTILIVEGRLTKDGDEDQIIKILATNIKVPTLPTYLEGRPILLSFRSELDYNMLKRIETMIEAAPGDSPVFVEFQSGPHKIKARFTKPTSLSIEQPLLELIGLNNLEPL